MWKGFEGIVPAILGERHFITVGEDEELLVVDHGADAIVLVSPSAREERSGEARDSPDGGEQAGRAARFLVGVEASGGGSDRGCSGEGRGGCEVADVAVGGGKGDSALERLDEGGVELEVVESGR